MKRVVEFLKFSNLYDFVFPVQQTVQTLNWFAKSKSISTPHLIKQGVVKNCQKKYKLRILVETGTYLGAMVNATKSKFKKIYTIELDEKLYKHAKNKFKNNNHIKVFLGDSSKVLPKILKQIRQPSLFWLDAHYSAGITAKGFKETPIMEELALIFKHKVKSHIILIDDANEFTGKNDYPTLNYLKKIISKNPNLKIEIKYNIIIISSKV